MATINLNISAFGVGTTDYSVRWRIYPSLTWVTTGITPSNPIATSNLAPSITVPNENTVYDIQIVGNCGSSTSQSAVFKKITRACPTLLQYSATVTDSSITSNFPLNAATPLTNHVSSILVELFQGVTLISSQTIAPTTLNTTTFTGLSASTTYTLKHTVTYTQSDTIVGTYSSGSTVNTQVCSTTILTTSVPTCVQPVITSITEV